MADIDEKRIHGMSLEDAKSKVKEVLNDLKNDIEYVTDIEWNQENTHADVSGKGFSGQLDVDDEKVELAINLKLLAKPFKGKIKEKVDNYLDKHFS